MDLITNQRKADIPTGVYQDLEEQLMANIIRHCKNYDQPIASDVWQMQKLAEIGRLNKENIRIIAKSSGLSRTAMERMLNDAAQEAIKRIDPGLQKLNKDGLIKRTVPPGKSKNLKQVLSNIHDQAKDTLNLCNTTMLYKARDAYKKLINNITSNANEIAEKQTFLNILNKNATAAVIGAESRQQAMRRCIREFNDKGIPAFVDKRGREWTPEAYVNMVMRNTVRQTAEQVQDARCKDAGVNLIAIDSHSGARPKCAKDQGKIFSLDNTSGTTEDLNGRKIKYYPWSSSSYGEPDGILGINCGHHKWPFIPGVNIQRYFPTDDMDANNKLYQETQVQRALERDVRKQKRECMLYDELGDKEAFNEAAVKLKQKESNLKTYVDSKDQLNRRKDREQVVGFDKRISAEAVAANKKNQKVLAEKIRDDKIKAEIKEIGMKGKIELSPSKKVDVSKFSFDDVHINKERGHKITRQDAERFLQEADISFTKWNGRFVNYYGPNGAVFIDVENDNIRTAFHSEEYDDKVKAMREVLKENGKS